MSPLVKVALEQSSRQNRFQMDASLLLDSLDGFVWWVISVISLTRKGGRSDATNKKDMFGGVFS